MKNLVSVSNLSLTYHSKKGETEALKDINFNVGEREFISIVGPSGCGKSTILSLIAGLLQPSNGEILVAGQKPNTKNCLTGYMFQKDNLFDWRDIEENVLLGLQIQKKKTPENIAYANSLLEKYGLADFKSHKPTELSGGMRQRVALIRTLALKPEILLLDEPFSALDYQTRLTLCDDVHEIVSKEKKTVILVTHDIKEAISFSDRVLILSPRPAHIVKEVKVDLGKYGSPFKRRESAEAYKLFEEIWSDIQYEKM